MIPTMPAVAKSTRFLDDAAFLRQCRLDQTTGSGPGGSKRNKTRNRLRLTHLPSGISAVAGEDRSLEVNRLRVIRRLRLKLACELREPPELARFEPPDWFLALRRNGRIEPSFRHPHFPGLVGLILDLFAAAAGNPASTAALLGVSTSSIVRVLEQDTAIWTAANSIRAKNALEPLTRRS